MNQPILGGYFFFKENTHKYKLAIYELLTTLSSNQSTTSQNHWLVIFKNQRVDIIRNIQK
jgi:hypothetical protein